MGQARSHTAIETAVPTGNTFDKYGSRNPLVRRLMERFERDLDALLRRAAPSSLVDVGCGEGIVSERIAREHRCRVVGLDLDDPKLKAHWRERSAPNLEFVVGDGGALPFADDEFDCASAIEVLEHVPYPEATLAEMARVARRYLVCSVPREPLWRALNVARGAYLRDLGNTPGHINHWSKRGFVALLSRFGTVEEVRTPLPWTMALVRLS